MMMTLGSQACLGETRGFQVLQLERNTQRCEKKLWENIHYSNFTKATEIYLVLTYSRGESGISRSGWAGFGGGGVIQARSGSAAPSKSCKARLMNIKRRWLFFLLRISMLEKIGHASIYGGKNVHNQVFGTMDYIIF